VSSSRDWGAIFMSYSAHLTALVIPNATHFKHKHHLLRDLPFFMHKKSLNSQP
jgi:hypothetical protein